MFYKMIPNRLIDGLDAVFITKYEKMLRKALDFLDCFVGKFGGVF